MNIVLAIGNLLATKILILYYNLMIYSIHAGIDVGSLQFVVTSILKRIVMEE